MFNRAMKQKVKELEADFKELKIKVNCLRDWHEWVVAQGLVIRCKHCHKVADKMPESKVCDGK